MSPKQDMGQPLIAHVDQSLSLGPPGVFEVYKSRRRGCFGLYQQVQVFQLANRIMLPIRDGEDEEWCEDESIWSDSDVKFHPSSDLDREWQRRKNQFHAIGYRDGLIAGKEASAQEGFNVGFKESVIVGFNLGLVRGVTGALDCLSDELRGKIIESQETRSKFHDLRKSVDKLSTADVLTVFGDDLSKRRIKHGDKDGCILPFEELNSDVSVLHSYYRQLQFLIMDSPALEVQLMDKAIDVTSTSQDPSLQ